MGRPRGTLLAWLVEHADPSHTAFPWDHPDEARFPSQTHHELAHARMLSAVMQGAALLYNLLLARRRAWQEKIDEFEQRLADSAQGLRVAAGEAPGGGRPEQRAQCATLSRPPHEALGGSLRSRKLCE